MPNRIPLIPMLLGLALMTAQVAAQEPNPIEFTPTRATLSDAINAGYAIVAGDGGNLILQKGTALIICRLADRTGPEFAGQIYKPIASHCYEQVPPR